MILYADDIAILCNDVDELAEILNIYDRTFKRFGLKIAYGKTETMAFNVPEEIKAKPTLFSVGDEKTKMSVSLNILAMLLLIMTMIHLTIFHVVFLQRSRNGTN